MPAYPFSRVSHLCYDFGRYFLHQASIHDRTMDSDIQELQCFFCKRWYKRGRAWIDVWVCNGANGARNGCYCDLVVCKTCINIGGVQDALKSNELIGDQVQ